MEFNFHYIVNYTYFAACSVGAVLGLKKGMRHFPIITTHNRNIEAALIWVLALYYLGKAPPPSPDANENDLKKWLVIVGVPWAICVLGLPWVARIIVALLDGLGKSAIQWLLTIATAITSYLVFTVSQGIADNLIRDVLQTAPDQFPGAQRALTAVFALYGWVIVLYTVAIISMFLVPMVEAQVTGRPVLMSATATVAMVFMLIWIPLTVIGSVQKAGSTDKGEQRAKREVSLVEYLILQTSFMTNRVVDGSLQDSEGRWIPQTHLACRNLSPEVYVAFVHPDEIMPTKAIVATPNTKGGAAYNYRLDACENSMNPDGLR